MDIFQGNEAVRPNCDENRGAKTILENKEHWLNFFYFICGETDKKTDSFHRTQGKDTTARLEVLKRTCIFETGSYAGINHIQMHAPENV